MRLNRNGYVSGVPVVLQKQALGLLIGQQATNASQAQRTVSDVGTGVGVGAEVGSAFGPVGTAIGAAVGAVVGAVGSLFGPAKEGMAAQTWDDMVKNGYLFKTSGTGFDERYFGEALKGAMDENNDVWPGCGKNGYKNPDCFYAPLAQQIIQGYLAKAVPLNASDSQVYSTIVLPWLQSGANGLFNYNNFAHEATQNQALLIKAAVNRYVNGLPITRANMPSYASQASSYAQWNTPSLATALASMIAAQNAPSQATAVTAAPATSNTQPPAAQTAAQANLVVSTPAQNVGPLRTAAGSTPTQTIAPTPVTANQAIVGAAANPTATTSNPLPATNAPVVSTSTNAATAAAAGASSSAPAAIPTGYGYNYAGSLVPIPSGYTLNSQNYIVDSSGYIFGSANDDQLTTAAATQVSPVASYTPTVDTSGESPIVVSVPTATATPVASDNSELYLIGAAVVLFLLLRK